jgi:AcrR family transcriptional regulator
MRAIGRELGVTHAALYRYFPDLRAVQAALSADMAAAFSPISSDLPWQDWLRETARAVRSVSLAHPEVGSPWARPAAAPTAHRMLVDGLTVLTRTFAAQDAILAIGLVCQLAEGSARSEASVNPQEPAQVPPELAATLTGLGLDETSFPQLDQSAVFERELDIVITGLEVSLTKRP